MKQHVESALARLPFPEAANRVAVFCYHSVHPSSPFSSISPDAFEQHLQWYRQHCEIIALDEIVDRASVPHDRPLVSLTFDDGFADNYHYAFPLLRRYEVPATFFISTGLVAGDHDVRRRFGVLCDVDGESIDVLSWQQIRAMHREGMSFGAHTHSHPSLGRLSRDSCVEEIFRSRNILEDRLQAPIRSFAYPFGKPRIHFTTDTMRIVEQLGFSLAVSIVYRGVRTTDHPLAIPRFAVNRDSPGVLAGKVSGRLDVIGFWQEHGPMWWARHVSRDRSRLLSLAPPESSLSPRDHDQTGGHAAARAHH